MSATSMVIGIEGRPGGRARVRTAGRAASRASGNCDLTPARVQGRPQAGAARIRSASASTASAPLRLTRRGRLVMTLALTCLIVAAFVVAGGASVATREGGAAEPVRVVEVEQGQTLWQIAASVAAPGETGDMVYRIRDLNSLPGSGLVEGQELAVPRR